MGITINISPARIAQVAVGGAALYGGYQATSALVSHAFREDLVGDPTRVVEIDGKTMIYQTREAQGGKLANVMRGAGAVACGIGGVLALHGPGIAGTGLKSALMVGGGLGVFALGVGAIVGASAASNQFRGAEYAPLD